jgi:hypothetical protein
LLASPSSPVREGYSYAESVKAKDVDNNNKFITSGVAAASPPIINEHDEEKNVAQGSDVNANQNQVKGKDKTSKDIESPNKEEDFATDLAIDHLAICNSKSPPLNVDSGSESESESESDISVGKEQHDFPKAQLKPGDVILFFDGAHHMRWENLRWAIVTSINAYHTTVDGIDGPVKCANIGLDTFANFGYPNNKVAVYRHDGHHMLQDVTDGNFVDPENLELVDGVLEVGSYSTDVDRFKDIAQSMEAQVQDKTGVVDVSLGVEKSKVKPNSNLTTVMKMIMAKTKTNWEDRRVSLQHKKQSTKTDGKIVCC